MPRIIARVTERISLSNYMTFRRLTEETRRGGISQSAQQLFINEPLFLRMVPRLLINSYADPTDLGLITLSFARSCPEGKEDLLARALVSVRDQNKGAIKGKGVFVEAIAGMITFWSDGEMIPVKRALRALEKVLGDISVIIEKEFISVRPNVRDMQLVLDRITSIMERETRRPPI